MDWRRLRLLWRRQALWLWRRRGRGIVSGDSDRRVRFTSDVARRRFVLGAEVAFLAVGAFVNATTKLLQHNMFVGRACAALNLAHNPLHEDQLLDADALREIIAAIELVQSRRRTRDIVRLRSVRGITPKTRVGSSPSEDCGGLAGGGSTADPRSAGAMHVTRTAVEAIATALLHGGTPAFLALEALVHAAAVLLRHAHVGRARVVPEPGPHLSLIHI